MHSIEGLSGLLAVLGHEPLYEMVPGLVARARGADAGAAVVVGRAGDFPWFAIAGAEPERLARKLAGRLLRRGRIAGVLALDPVSRRLGTSIGPWLPPR